MVIKRDEEGNFEVCRNISKTPPYINNQSPFMAESFTISDSDLPPDFTQIVISLWRSGQTVEKLLSQVVVPRSLMALNMYEDDQWHMLQPVNDASEKKITGQIKLGILYAQPRNNKPSTYTIHIMKAKGLALRTSKVKPDVYAVIRMLSLDAEHGSFQTRILRDTTSPNFNENFIFVIDEVNTSLELHVSLWDHLKDTFLGHLVIPLQHFQDNVKSEDWYLLYDKPPSIKANLSNFIRKKGNDSKGDKFLASLQNSLGKKRMHKLLDTRLNTPSVCCHCFTMLFPGYVHLQCSNCKLNCHVNCSKFIANNCGDIGSLKFHLKYTEINVCSFHVYSPLVEMMKCEQFLIPIILGQVSQGREEASICLLKIFENQGGMIDMMGTIIENEVHMAETSATLFRANSMGSKMVEMYLRMKHLPYLKSVIGNVIQDIITKRISCEIDPTKLKPGEDIARNKKNLQDFHTAIVEAIIKNEDNIPNTVRHFLSRLQRTVIESFPSDYEVRFTSVAGFLFLRYFAPAVLNPRLFGLYDENPDEQLSRTCTLLAKCLQTLANMAEFGPKEQYMTEMNPIILSQRELIKKYINNASRLKPNQNIDDSPVKTQSDEEICVEFAKICDILKCDYDAILTEIVKRKKSVKVVEDLGKFIKGYELILEPKTEEPSDGTMGGSTLTRAMSVKRSRLRIQHKPSIVPTVSNTSLHLSSALQPDKRKSSIENIVIEDIDAFKHPPSSLQIIESIPENPSEPKPQLSPAPPIENPVEPKLPQAIPETHTEPKVTPITSENTTTLEPRMQLTLPDITKEASLESDFFKTLRGAIEISKGLSTIGTSPSKPRPAIKLNTCAICGKEDRGDMVLVGNRGVHRSHLKCVICHESLDPMAATYHRHNIYCQSHYKDMQSLEEACCACKLPFLNKKVINACGAFWHPECFVCHECGCLLQQGFFTLDEKPFCKEDFYKLAGFMCGVCGEVIETEYIEISGRRYHATCKVCQLCQKSLVGCQFLIYEDEVYCAEHKEELTCCCICHQAINGAYILSLDEKRKYHPEHLNCTSCGINLADQAFVEKEQKVYCIKCY